MMVQKRNTVMGVYNVRKGPMRTLFRFKAETIEKTRKMG